MENSLDEFVTIGEEKKEKKLENRLTVDFS